MCRAGQALSMTPSMRSWKEPLSGREGEDLIIQLNDLLVQNYVLIPLINRATVSSAVGNSLKGVRLNAWDAELWNIHEWYR